MSGCIRCGAKMEPDDRFCSACGYPAQKTKVQSTYASGATSYTTVTNTRSVNVNIPVCIRCGAKIEATYKNCPNCGYAIQRPNQQQSSNSDETTGSTTNQESKTYTGPVNTKPPQINTKEECIAELTRTYWYFNTMHAEYDEYDACIRNSNFASREYRKRTRHDSDETNFSIFFCAVGTALFIVGIVIWLLFEESFYKSILWLIIGSLIGSAGVLMWIKEDSINRILRKEIKNNTSRQVQLAKELTKYYKNYGYCIIGPQYSNPKIIWRILENLKSGRADTLQNAIKLLYRDARKRTFHSKLILGEAHRINAFYHAYSAASFIPADFFITAV